MKRKISALLLFIQAWVCIAIARCMLVFMPFRKIAPLLGKSVAAVDPFSTRRSSRPERIRAAIRRAAACSPWRAKCFEQALAGKMMLTYKHMSGIVFFGINKVGDDLKAHAWLESEGVIITGGREADQFIVIARFQS
ncbi:lasso peptide biosynthesis B2 protein [Chitinophaga filiformis]|uniref:Transglutaminase-like superfamily protein n=1 Tax=Chitinophaga filiformis TaxID=104663 RepID=A0A1G7N0T3_CHIFI|nr:lasso peptide biosynthesis B2 protein [Chitinophaga filiformis]SDF67695.1 Transglutaminase-like superfamily protein [Chitinophaga filiformis]